MNVIITKQYEKDFRSLPIQIKNLAVEAYEHVSAARTVYDIHQCVRLKGFTDRYRIKIGAYRILFLVVIKEDSVEFRRVLPRGQAYKRHIT